MKVTAKSLPVAETLLCAWSYAWPGALSVFLAANQHCAERFATSLTFNMALFVALTTFIRTIHWQRARRATYLMLALFLYVYTFLAVYHFLLYLQPFGLTSAVAAISSNPGEIRGYIADVFNEKYFIIAAISSLPPLALASRRWSLKRLSFFGSGRDRTIGGILLATMIAMVWMGRNVVDFSNPMLFVIQSIETAQAQRLVMMELSHRGLKHDARVQGDISRSDAVHVLVIGESMTRNHMSLYGYNRETTPNLNRLGKELFVARDVCSSRGATSASLKEMLTFATREDPRPLFEEPNLLDLMKAAGFATTWISNQEKIAFADSWLSVFPNSATRSIFVNVVGGQEGVSYDANVIAPFEAALTADSDAKFIIVHLMGSHAIYSARYPNGFATFTATADIPRQIVERSSSSGLIRSLNFLSISNISKYNSYDDSIKYNDFVVSELLGIFKKHNGSTFTYLSDHGESLGETSTFIGHIDGVAPRQVYQTPLLFYISPEFQSKISAGLPSFRENLEKPFQSDSLIHTLLDLFGVRHPLLQPTRSLFDKNYTPYRRFCETLPL